MNFQNTTMANEDCVSMLRDFITSKLYDEYKLETNKRNLNQESILEFFIESLMEKELDTISQKIRMNLSDSSSDLETNTDLAVNEIINQSLSFQILQSAAQKFAFENQSKEHETINCFQTNMNTKKAKRSTKQSSFSLFDLLDQQGTLQEIITLEKIFDCYRTKSMMEVIQMIEEVEAIEDIADPTQWPEFNEIMYLGLKPSLENHLPSPSVTNRYDIQIKFTNMHWKLFSACTPDYATLRKDLFLNLVRATFNIYERFSFVLPSITDESESFFSFSNDNTIPLVQLLAHQIATLMKMVTPLAASMRYLPSEDVYDIFVQMLLLLRNITSEAPIMEVKDDSRGNRQSNFLLLPAHLMAALNPYADWFSVWVKQISPVQLNQILLHTGILDDILWRIKISIPVFSISDATIPVVRKVNNQMEDVTNELLKNNNAQIIIIQPIIHSVSGDAKHDKTLISTQQLNMGIFQQSLSMLRSILNVTRVSFPFAYIQYAQSKEQIPFLSSSNIELMISNVKSVLESSNDRSQFHVSSNVDDSKSCIHTWSSVKTTIDLFMVIIKMSSNSNIPNCLIDICGESFETIATVCYMDWQMMLELYRFIVKDIIPIISLQVENTNKLKYDPLPYSVKTLMKFCSLLMSYSNDKYKDIPSLHHTSLLSLQRIIQDALEQVCFDSYNNSTKVSYDYLKDNVMNMNRSLHEKGKTIMDARLMKFKT